MVRIETDSDGVYEAHLTKADGTPVTVEVDKSFTVTGIEQGGSGGGHRGAARRGPAAGRRAAPPRAATPPDNGCRPSVTRFPGPPTRLVISSPLTRR